MKKTKKAYDDIIKLLHKHRKEIIFDVSGLENQAKHHLFGLELSKEYGFDIDPTVIHSAVWQELKSNVYISFMDGINTKISWSDDGKQPNGETLLVLKYPTGAYFFSRDYPTDFFNKFFKELKSYKPKYIDSENKSLYFSMENASNIFNNYDNIVNRYFRENEVDLKKRKVKQLKDEITKIELNA